MNADHIARRFFLGFAVATMVLAGFVAAPADAQEGTIRIGYQKYGNLILLKGSGTLESKLAEIGYRVQWTEFPGGPQLLEALNVGAIDFGSTGEAPPIFAQAAGAPLVYVAYEPPAPRGEAILVPADSTIQTVEELAGKTVALNRGSNVHYLLVKALEEAGLAYEDVDTVFLPPADGRAAFESGSVDAWAIWDPFSAAAEVAIEAREIRNGEGIVSNHQFYLGTEDLVANHRQALDALIVAIDGINAWTQSNTDEAAAELAPEVGIPADILQVALERQSYGIRTLDDSVIAEQQAIADTFHELNLIPEPLVIADAVWKPDA